MANIEEYDLVVLGSGKAGKLLAWTLAAEGKRVAVVERREYVGIWKSKGGRRSRRINGPRRSDRPRMTS